MNQYQEIKLVSFYSSVIKAAAAAALSQPLSFLCVRTCVFQISADCRVGSTWNSGETCVCVCMCAGVICALLPAPRQQRCSPDLIHQGCFFFPAACCFLALLFAATRANPKCPNVPRCLHHVWWMNKVTVIDAMEWKSTKTLRQVITLCWMGHVSACNVFVWLALNHLKYEQLPLFRFVILDVYYILSI